MDNNSVAIAALGVLGSCVALMAWVVKKVLGDVEPALRKHAETADNLGHAVDRNTESSKELLAFMRNLNGKLAHITSQKIEERHVTKQIVDNQDV